MYTVPVIPPDLRHEETIIQAAIALDCLNKTINSVFDRIDSRTQRNNEKVEDLNKRIQRAQTKIRSLVGTKKAIKIYAPARFPSSQVFHDIPKTFTYSEALVQQKPEENQNPKYEVHSRLNAPATQALQEKLVFFHVRCKDFNTAMHHGPTVAAQKAQVSKSLGMGAVPEKLRSISSLLHCNCEELVYGAEIVEKDLWKKGKFLKVSRPRHDNNTEQKQRLEPAPHSLAHRNQKVNSFRGFRYTPRLHDAPEIDLPLDLPDLPGIADDIHFEGKVQQQIAPSLYIENLPDLPELEEAATVDIANTPKNSDEGNDGDTMSPPLPPTQAQAVTEKNSNSVQKTAAVEPPPPPPPLPPPAPPAPTLKEKSETINLPPSNTDNSRNELMDAIRKAGGARGGRLRSAAAAPIDVVDNCLIVKSSETNLKTAGGGGGDLMADLHNKLLMRRKGISGAAKNKEVSAGSSTENQLENATFTTGNPVMSRLSALIPPPTGQKHSEDDEDDDNDNDTDWIE